MKRLASFLIAFFIINIEYYLSPLTQKEGYKKIRQVNLPFNRKSVLSTRFFAEHEDVCDILDLVNQEISSEIKDGAEPKYFKIEFDRMGDNDVDRYTDYVLGNVVEYLKVAGWLETSFSLIDDNEKIVLWIK